MKKIGNILGGCALAFSSVMLSQQASATVISADASGSTSPTIVPGANVGSSITNGDFTITRTGGNSTLGNGVDEATTWTFDYGTSSIGSTLDSALLTMTVDYRSGLFTTDSFKIQGLSGIGSAALTGLVFYTPITVTVDLLNYYTSAEILSAFNGGVAGQIDMYYQDDAIISYARLDLSSQVPEPLTITLLLAGLMGLYASQKKTSKAATKLEA